MKDGYRPKGDISSDNLVPPNIGSSIMNEEKSPKKSFGAIIDELLNNPELMMVQAGAKYSEWAKKEAEKVVNKNKELEAEIIEKDKEISYLKGKVDTMEKIIKEMNALIELTVEK